MFDRQIFNATLLEVAKHYEQSSQVVKDWCDDIASGRPSDITLADVELIQRLDLDRPHFRTATKLVQRRMGW
jgi:hypothetical protein